MNAIRQIFDDTSAQLRIDLPPEFQHRRVEVIVLPLDDSPVLRQERANPRYQTLKVDERVIFDRETLHER